jgi:hypothetical protein
MLFEELARSACCAVIALTELPRIFAPKLVMSTVAVGAAKHAARGTSLLWVQCMCRGIYKELFDRISGSERQWGFVFGRNFLWYPYTCSCTLSTQFTHRIPSEEYLRFLNKRALGHVLNLRPNAVRDSMFQASPSKDPVRGALG